MLQLIGYVDKNHGNHRTITLTNPSHCICNTIKMKYMINNYTQLMLRENVELRVSILKNGANQNKLPSLHYYNILR